MEFQRVVILDIDGLRRDVFLRAIKEKLAPNLCRLIQPNGMDCSFHVPAVSIAPSITFAAQASIFTGAHPAEHRIPGNNFIDRIGTITDGKPRHYALDAGDTFEVLDAIQAFRSDLGDRLLNPLTPTLYESAAAAGKTSMVMANMYNRGAQVGLLPSVLDMARVFMDYGPLQLTPEECDNKTLATAEQYLQVHDYNPDLFTFYFVGLDLYSHDYGPAKQIDYLCGCVDGQIGRVMTLLQKTNMYEGTLFVFVSDHGQIDTPGDDAHTIRLGFPFNMELTPVFHALGMDLYDMPSEGNNVDVVVGLNGGLGSIYIRNPLDGWRAFPRFEEEVLQVAQAFWEMNETGKYQPELQGTLELILVRNAEESQSWKSDYVAYLGAGKTQPFSLWLEEHPEIPLVDAENRIRNATSVMSGDLILFAKAEEGVYFGIPGHLGVHGSLHSSDSQSVFSLSCPTASAGCVDDIRHRADALIQERCRRENNRHPSIVDISYVLRNLWLEPNKIVSF